MSENGNGQEIAWFFAYGLPLDLKAFESAGIRILETRLGALKHYRLDFNVLEDELFRFERRGVANIMPKPGHNVEGLLCRIAERDLRSLDRFAGVPCFKYYRKMVPVRDRDGNSIQSYVYAGWPDVTSNGLKPSRSYLRVLTKTANRLGFSPDYLQWLESHPTAM